MKRSLFTIISIITITLLPRLTLAEIPDHYRIDYYSAGAKAHDHDQDRRVLGTVQDDFLQGITTKAFCDGRELGLMVGPHVNDAWIDRIEVLFGASMGTVADASRDTIKVSYLNAQINWWAHFFPFNMDWRSNNLFASGQHGNGNYVLSDNSFTFGQALIGIRSYSIVEGVPGASPKHWDKWRLYVGPQVSLPKLGGVTFQVSPMLNAQTPGDFMLLASAKY